MIGTPACCLLPICTDCILVSPNTAVVVCLSAYSAHVPYCTSSLCSECCLTRSGSPCYRVHACTVRSIAVFPFIHSLSDRGVSCDVVACLHHVTFLLFFIEGRWLTHCAKGTRSNHKKKTLGGSQKECCYTRGKHATTSLLTPRIHLIHNDFDWPPCYLLRWQCWGFNP